MINDQFDRDVQPSFDGDQTTRKHVLGNPYPVNLCQISQQPLFPDTVEHVEDQSEDVLTHYLYQSLGNHEGIVQPSPKPDTDAAKIGRYIVRVGDEINDKYSDELDGMVSELTGMGVDLSSIDVAYAAFCKVASGVFEEGINWGRIFILLSFGYRMAKKVLEGNLSQFLAKIVKTIFKFMVERKITQWIADNGGWVAALMLVPQAVSNRSTLWYGVAALSLGAIAIFAVKYLKS